MFTDKETETQRGKKKIVLRENISFFTCTETTYEKDIPIFVY